MAPTVLHHLRRHAERIPDRPAYGEKIDGEWRVTPWGEYWRQVRRAARGLIALEVPEGGRVAIFGNNCPEWTITCLATMAVRGVPVGIYQTCSAEQAAYILEHAGVSVVMVEDGEFWSKIESVLDRVPGLRHGVLLRDERPPGADDRPDGPTVHTWEEFSALGDEVPESDLDARIDALGGDETATFIYTSGTTGRPKAVMLSHSNLVETGRIGQSIHDLQPGDTILSYLPLAHVAEQMMTVHMPAYAGYTVFYAESPEKLLDHLLELQPTIFFSVPRVWEKFHSGIVERLRRAGLLRRLVVRWAMRAGYAYSQAKNHGDAIGPWLALRFALADRLVLSKVRAALGLRDLRVAASGAAPIPREILDYFAGLGVRIYEVYGLSETCGPGTWNRAGLTRLGTVGPVIPEVELKIAEDGEVCFRGPNVFQGYHKDPEATAEAIDEEGFFHTGDLGSVDDEGFLTITGRKKEIIITSGGKNIAPAGIEGHLKTIDLVGDAMVVGDDRRFLVALLTLDEEAAARFAEDSRLDPATLHESPEVLEVLRAGVREVNRQVARVESVRNFRVLPRRFDPDEDELTPTLKLKRPVIQERYAAIIDEMYDEGQVIQPEAAAK